MRRAKVLIRCGLCLIPWLPAFLLSVFVYAYYFAPPRYVRVTTLELRVPPNPTSAESPARRPFAFNPVALPLGWHFPERINFPMLVLICTADAFVLGCVLLWIGFRARSTLRAIPLERVPWSVSENPPSHAA